MKCLECAADNPSGSRFCAKCAMPLPVRPAVQSVPTETIQTAIIELIVGSVFASHENYGPNSARRMRHKS
jgi:hypothetical protein